jgi:ATP-dependent protease Clp ATPase subunit
MARLMRCSFCGKSEKQVARLIDGAHALICDDCVGTCVKILEAAPTTPMAEDDILASLAACNAAVDASRDVLQRRIDHLRSQDVSWEVIGRALGVSRQAAWERFR